jgi:hypothetical protein
MCPRSLFQCLASIRHRADLELIDFYLCARWPDSIGGVAAANAIKQGVYQRLGKILFRVYVAAAIHHPSDRGAALDRERHR